MDIIITAPGQDYFAVQPRMVEFLLECDQGCQTTLTPARSAEIAALRLRRDLRKRAAPLPSPTISTAWRVPRLRQLRLSLVPFDRLLMVLMWPLWRL